MKTSPVAVFRALNALGIIAICLVLAFALADQFYMRELPCPLCLLQRVGFVAVAIGLLMNVVLGSHMAHYGFSVVAGLCGGAAALRQVSLHVIPGTPAYGEPFLGLHFYTWAFILFGTIIFGIAVLASFQAQYGSSVKRLAWSEQTWLCKLSIASAIMIVALNFLSTFALCGPGVCPDDPVGYWLMS